MDPRLVRYYNTELQHLREMGGEFAEQFPKIAARLGMNGLEVADPYVERLLEGVAFLAARVQLKLDAEFPRFTQSLLDIVYPHYLAPTPSMVVAKVTVDPTDPALAKGSKSIPRGTTMSSAYAVDDVTTCEFRTAQDVDLWPVELTSASYFSFAPDLSLNALPIAQRIKGGIRFRLKTPPEIKFAQLGLDRLTFYVTGGDEIAHKLYELCLGSALGALVLPGKGTPRWHEFIAAGNIRPIGFEDNQALLPVSLRSFQGYRLLQEYFTFPERFRFVEIAGLGRATGRVVADEIELVVLLGRGEPTLESLVDVQNFALHCTPAINLFSKRADRIHVNDASYEFHVTGDRTRPMDFEIYEVTDVVGYGSGEDSEQRFLPFYSAYSMHRHSQQTAYFTTRREPRLLSSTQKRRGPRSTYIGTEVFLSLVDPSEAPFHGNLRQLSVQTLCTNRDLVLHMPLGSGSTDFHFDIAAPVKSIRVISGPSRPHAPLTDGAISWRAINHLSLNYFSLVNSTAREGASALRELLELYAVSGNPGAKRQIDGVRAMAVRPVVRRLGSAGPLAFGRGLEITVTVDEMAFEGASAFVLGSVLSRYFARHVSINSFTETILRSESRGEIYRWVPTWGARPTL